MDPLKSTIYFFFSAEGKDLDKLTILGFYLVLVLHSSTSTPVGNILGF